MTLLSLQHPILCVLFILAFILILLTARASSHTFFLSFAAALCILGLTLGALICSIPLTELLLLLLALTLTGLFCPAKGGDT